MKKILALLLMISILLGMVSCLSGCEKSKLNITKGELLNLMCDAFGMYKYTSAEPHTNVKSDNKYFDAVQAMYEWEIIDGKKINVNEQVDKDFLSKVLVKSASKTDVSKMSTEELTKYAVDNGFVNFKYRGRTDGKRLVKHKEAVASIASSVKLWSERKYDKTVEEIVYGDKTHNFAQAENKVTTTASGNVVVTKDEASDIKVGDYYVAYDNKTNSQQIYKAKEVIVNGDNVTIVPSDEKPELQDAIQDMQVSGNVVPDLTQCYITDGVGNVINAGGAVQSQSNVNAGSNVVTLAGKSDEEEEKKLPKGTFALNFEIDGVKITGSVSSDKISFKAKGELWANRKENIKVAVDRSYDIKDIDLDYDYTIEWFDLKYAYAKLNYTTVDTTKVGIKFEENKTLKDWTKWRPKTEELKKQINSAVLDKTKKLQTKAGKTIKICDVPVYTNGAVSFNIVVKLKISVSGEAKLVVTTSNAKGIEYKKGNLRYIKEEKKDTDFEISAKAELTLYIGASFKALGVDIIGLGIEGGIGAVGTITIHIADQENRLITQIEAQAELHVTNEAMSGMVGMSVAAENEKTITLHPQVCFDYKVYGILKFTIDDDSVIGKLFKGTEVEILGEDNATIKALSGHIEDGVNVKECTRKFRTDEDEEETSSEEVSSNGNSSDKDDDNAIISGESLDIDTYFISLSVGETDTLKVDTIPKGYSNKDIVFKSSNENVVKINSSGKLTAVGSGNATISVETKDGKYKQECTIYVISESSTITWTPLSEVVFYGEVAKV